MERAESHRGHPVCSVAAGSIAEELGIEAGDTVLAVNGEAIADIFDYRFFTADEELTLLVRKQDGEEWEFAIEKDADEDLGIAFANGLMDEYRSCRNHCIFCFIDQMPKGMRETLYFKDDDSRLSFLQGNYVTLTNLSDADIDRITKYHMSPINISFHTTDPALRCRMLGNRFAGEALDKVDRLIAGDPRIELNGQIVLCRGINDGEALERTLTDLTKWLPNLQSVSVVPVGLTKYREGLWPLEPFTGADAESVLAVIEAFQDRIHAAHGTHFVHASDEWYLLAGREVPAAETYDGYPQLENGVGMLRLLMDSFAGALEEALWLRDRGELAVQSAEISCVTGKLVHPTIRRLIRMLQAEFPEIYIHLYEIRNDFFGERITVTGLLTGRDIIAQLAGKPLGERLLLPGNLFRAGEDVLLDDLRAGDIEKALGVPVKVFDGSGEGTLCAFLGLERDGGTKEHAAANAYEPAALDTEAAED